MKKAWENLTLGGYLEETKIRSDVFSTTFSRTFPRTDELPELTVGLGILVQNAHGKHRVLAAPRHLQWVLAGNAIKRVVVMEEHLIDAVLTETRACMASYQNWQEHLLLRLGYVTNLLSDKLLYWDEKKNYNLLDPIPEEEREFLLRKHGLHKIAAMVAHGHTQELDAAISTIDELRGGANYGDALRVMAMGVPLEDVPVAAQLPVEMVAGIYNHESEDE